MTKFLKKKKKKHVFGCTFLVHFANFWGKTFFLKNPALSRTTSYGFLVPCQNLEKNNNAIPRKRPDRRKDGRTKTLFYRTLSATTGGPTIPL